MSEMGFCLFKFFASLKLAIFVLVALMAVFALGTILESAYGTDAARLLIYESPWFSLLLFLLGVNVAAAALDRLPWKRKHTGFVITHLGIILMLVGSFISSAFMIDGQVAVQEGQTESRLTLPNPVLYLYSESQKKEWAIPFKKSPFEWQGKKRLRVPAHNTTPGFEMDLLNFYPKARMREELIQAAEGPAALKVTLHNSFVNQSEWLSQAPPEKSEALVGPAKIKFAGELLKETTAVSDKEAYLEFQFADRIIPVPLSGDLKLPAQFSLEGTDYGITVTRVLKNAVVVNNQLVEERDAELEGQTPSSAEGRNPAVELLLEGKGVKEKHTVFAKYPDFPTQHGMKPSHAGVRIFYRLPGGGSRGQSHELRFVHTAEGLFYQVQTGLKIKTEKAVPGEEIPTGWMDLTFRVDEFYPHARWTRNFTVEPNTTQKDDAVSAIRLALTQGTENKEIWLRQGFPEKLEFAGKNYVILYGEKRIPLGFRLALRDFRMEHYPGTNNPASFESDVTLRDDLRGVQRDVTISMNQPL
ncbi:MAG TPA: cytochrome c biogenesis protein ResB, partial [bacterium]|nr:cytochrome c biogenesis protein ResB [bacterium]